MYLKKNDIVELTVEDLTVDGSGIGKYDGLVVFVPNSAIGDRLSVKILKVKKKYAYGKIEKVLEKSEDRIEVDCESYFQCGGCKFRHISYEAELKIKEKRVKDSILRIGKITDFKMNPIERSINVNHYRNKSQMPIGKNSNNEYILGFFAPNTHRIVNCQSCYLHPEEFNNIIKSFIDWLNLSNLPVYDETTNTGLLRHLYLRKAKVTDEVMVCIVINGDSLPYSDKLIEMLLSNNKNIKSICINFNKDKTNVILGSKTKTIYGKDYIEDILCGLKFKISPKSFYQVNRDQAEKLYSIAKKYANLNKTDILLDLYCGTGTIGLTMAKDCEKLIGVEIVDEAIKDAKENAKLNNISNCEFICSDAKAAAFKLSEDGSMPDVVIIDPPRKGCSAELIQIISSMVPKRVVYVSCDPATLARDLNIFSKNGYRVVELTPVDMFPRTSHVETVCLLINQNAQAKHHVNVGIDAEDYYKIKDSEEAR